MGLWTTDLLLEEGEDVAIAESAACVVANVEVGGAAEGEGFRDWEAAAG